MEFSKSLKLYLVTIFFLKVATTSMAFVITARGDQLSSTTRDYSGQDFDEESTTISPNSGDNGLSNPVPNVTRQNRENSTNIVELPPKKEELPTQPPAIQIGSKPNITISHNAPIVIGNWDTDIEEAGMPILIYLEYFCDQGCHKTNY
ncbi:hypothetical protein Fcan01_11414 [Folsomia candida]|uniref:Uncharacterized protein n=1 Tax=Folsomia candida TaxID=158441 RepID=A0A226E8R6_FOLCA|nr:hypothetical protein Fcan01_11414 [Folsomia candida]